MKRINSLVWGTVLLLVGVVLTLGQLGWINLDHLTWPIILLAIGVIFHLYYIFTKDHNEGLLVPGGILLVYGVLFLLSQSGQPIEKLWPMFILGPAFGLFELYLFSRGRMGSMIPVFILTAIGGGFMLMNYDVANGQVILAVLAICLGAGLMISAFFRGSRHKTAGSVPFEVTADAEPKSETKSAEVPSGDQSNQ